MRGLSTSNFLVKKYKVQGFLFGLGAMSLTTSNELKNQLVSDCSLKEIASLKAGGNAQAEFFKQLNIILILITFVVTSILAPFTHFLQSAGKEADWNHEAQVILAKEKIAMEESIEGKAEVLRSLVSAESKGYLNFVTEISKAYILIVFIVVIPVVLILIFLLSRYKFLLSLSFCLDAAFEEKKDRVKEAKDKHESVLKK